MTNVVGVPQDIEMYRGDDEFFDVVVRDSNTLAIVSLVSMTGRKFWFTVKQQVDDPDNLILFQKTSASGEGITVTDAAGGTIRISIAGTDTEKFNPPATFYYDVRFRDVVSGSPRVTTLVFGKLTVVSNLTRGLV